MRPFYPIDGLRDVTPFENGQGGVAVIRYPTDYGAERRILMLLRNVTADAINPFLLFGQTFITTTTANTTITSDSTWINNSNAICCADCQQSPVWPALYDFRAVD